MTVTSSGWCDTVIQDELLSVSYPGCKEMSQQKDMQKIVKKPHCNQTVNEVDFCKWDGCGICEFLISMAKFAGYEQ